MTPAAEEHWEGRRIGILGGTFDPPHVGHTRMAAVARDVLDLDFVLLAPAPHPPHKPDTDTTPLAHRTAMVEAAIAGEERLRTTHIEDPDATSYTVDLLRAARARASADLYFILGADSLAELSSWRDPGEIMRLATLVVFPRRTGTTPSAVVRAPDAREASLVVFESPVIDVSSTAIRAELARGATSVAGVAPPVMEYITRHGLYARG
jgi:nicotinate-nucleotide adenylyltransferase